MRTLDRAHLADAVSLLVKAFDEDPFFRWLLPADRERSLLVHVAMQGNVELALPRGAATGIADPVLRGVCLWFEPGTYPVPLLRTLRVRAASLGWMARRGAIRPKVLSTALRMADLMDEAHPPGDYYYLQVLGVHPSYHGRGLGSSMLRASVARADREHKIAILETSKPINVKLYRRFGFEIVHTTVLDSCPPIWTMRRDPAPLS